MFPPLPPALCIYIQHRHWSGSNCRPGRLLQAGDVKIQEPGGGGVGQTGCRSLCYKMHCLSRGLRLSAGYDTDTKDTGCSRGGGFSRAEGGRSECIASTEMRQTAHTTEGTSSPCGHPWLHTQPCTPQHPGEGGKHGCCLRGPELVLVGRVPSEAPRPAPNHLPAVVLSPPWSGRPSAVFLEREGPAPGREAEGCECN